MVGSSVVPLAQIIHDVEPAGLAQPEIDTGDARQRPLGLAQRAL